MNSENLWEAEEIERPGAKICYNDDFGKVKLLK